MARAVRKPAGWRSAALAGALLAAAPGLADAACMPIVCKFSVSGKKGPYLEKQVDDAQLVAADAKVSSKLSGGRSLAEQSANRGEFAGTGLRMRETERALDALQAKLRAGWKRRPPPPITFRIIGSTNFNPSARPDNVIVVPLGVLIRATSDDEVAWVIAHEFSHIGLAHFSREAEQRRLKSAVNQVMTGLQTAADMSQQRVDSSGQRVRFYRVEDKGAENFSNQVWARSRDVGMALELLNQQLSREQEDQADAAGLDLILAAGYSDVGPGDALDAVQEDEKRLASSLTSLQSQIADVSKRAGTQSLLKIGAGKSISETTKELFDDMGRNLGRVLVNKLIEVASTSHRPAEVRKRGVNDYLDAAYKDFQPPKKQTAWLDAVRSTREFQEAQAAVEARDKALARLQSDSPQAAKEAWDELQPALRTSYAATPLIANATAKIYEALNDLPAADRQYGLAEHPPAPAPAPAAKAATRRAAGKGRSGPAPAPAAAAAPAAAPDILFLQSLEGYRDHVKLLVRMKAWPKALTVVDEAKGRFGDDDPFLPSLITIYAQTAKPNQLAAAISRCLDTEDDALRKQCQYAMLSDEQLKQIDNLPPADRAKVEEAMDKTSDASRRANWWQNLTGPLLQKTGN
jgi:hypothetical protein